MNWTIFCFCPRALYELVAVEVYHYGQTQIYNKVSSKLQDLITLNEIFGTELLVWSFSALVLNLL